MTDENALKSNNPPTWVDAELFENLFKKHLRTFKEIKEFKAYEGVPPGENYSTIISRIEILIELEDGSTNTKFFMLKTEHESELYKQLTGGIDCFAQEPKVYKELIPAFEKLYKDAGKDVKFGAKYYRLDIPNHHLLLEDLCRRGFKNANRLECLDMKHAKLVLKKMAEWHAASAVHKENIGSYEEIYKTALYHDVGRKSMSVFFEGMTKYLLKCLHLYDNPEQYREKIEKLLAIIMDKLFEAVKVDENDFNVLNHADLWTNNIMFQYDNNGQPLETYFVDYAFPKYGSPTQDLIYFIISSLQVDIQIKQFDHLIQYYHENLVENLQLLKYPQKLPTLREILMMLHKYNIWGFCSAVGVMAVCLMDASDMSTFANFLGENNDGDNFKLLMFTNKRYRQHMNAVLPWLLNRGALDF